MELGGRDMPVGHNIGLLHVYKERRTGRVLHQPHSNPTESSNIMSTATATATTPAPAPHEGRYLLRGVSTSNPNPDDGGLFATGGNPSQPVTTAPNTPRFADRQTWEIVKNKDADTYKIVYAGETPHPKEGFTFATPDSDVPITLGPAKDFTFELWPDTKDVWVIRPANLPSSGFDICVGLNDDKSQLVVERILFTAPGLFTKEVRPAWELHRA
ncbi:hypothetical protein BOTBODRAFT_35397 [Botryobasidium botryosum FD-172 SS1]|uniref:Uncharacterized protein n=1 Tax=Botryobasidium botryosum (strain FD-172 SS1) TaxID=930990 RepID=A0A067M721_BOTB1|nr:hypothetical protein BOTBODRAFT_35397 [Botryobasidium botryosum FD-172 SS1]